jgi:glycosyltransferase involved in cell wall biosynthesis
MIPTGSRILLVSPEAWGPAKLSKHHYAQALQDQGMRVYFMGPSDSDRFSLEPLDNGITLVHGPAQPRGLRWAPIRFREWVEAQRMAGLARLCGGPFDVLWNFDLFRFRWLRDRRHARSRVLHVMDLPRATALRDPATRADAIVLVSPAMASHLPPGSVAPLIVPHGLSTHASQAIVPPDLKPGIRVGYLGNMAIPYLDKESLLRAVRQHSRITLYLIGPHGGNLGQAPVDRTWQSLIAEPNVVWVGAVPSEHVGAWLNKMDLLLIAYDSGRYANETAHPHKVLEYLASGRPILATHMRDMAHLPPLIEMLPLGMRVDQAMTRTLGELERLSSAELVQARRTHAQEHSYSRHTARILHHLGSLNQRP